MSSFLPSVARHQGFAPSDPQLLQSAMEVRFPPGKKSFNIGIGLPKLVQLGAVMSMGKMIPTVRHQTLVSTVFSYVLDPAAGKRRVAIAAGKLAGPIKADFQGAEIDVLVCWCIPGFLEGCLIVNY